MDEHAELLHQSVLDKINSVARTNTLMRKRNLELTIEVELINDELIQAKREILELCRKSASMVMKFSMIDKLNQQFITMIEKLEDENNALRDEADEANMLVHQVKHSNRLTLPSDKCTICLSSIAPNVLSIPCKHCLHHLHFMCFQSWWQFQGRPECIRCPMCRQINSL